MGARGAMDFLFPNKPRRSSILSILPLAACGTVGRSLAKPRSSGKCWLSDLARMCKKVDFPSTVLVVFNCKEAKHEQSVGPWATGG